MSLQHVTINCARTGCYAVITVHPQEEARLRRAGETFYCPAGHSNYFPTKPDKRDRRIAVLEEDLRHWQGRRTEALQSAELFAHGLRVCPLGCGWHTTRQARGLWAGDHDALRRYMDRCGHDLAEHLQDAHHASARVVAGLLGAGEAS